MGNTTEWAYDRAFFTQNIMQVRPMTHSNLRKVANGVASISTVMKDQLKEFVQAINADENLSGGFNAVGMSQGNLLIRAYIEMYNDPPVHTFISMVGPHDGVADCPDNFLFKIACQAVWGGAPYDQPIVF